MVPPSSDTSTGSAPASSSACHGRSSSTCSTPSVASTATFIPSRSPATSPAMRARLPGPSGQHTRAHYGPTGYLDRRERAMSGRRGLAVLGGGKMGEALLAGLVRRSGPEGVVVCERHPERGAELAARYGIDVVDVAGAAARARVLLLAV